jgi:hypothetical protein
MQTADFHSQMPGPARTESSLISHRSWQLLEIGSKWSVHIGTTIRQRKRRSTLATRLPLTATHQRPALAGRASVTGDADHGLLKFLTAVAILFMPTSINAQIRPPPLVSSAAHSVGAASVQYIKKPTPEESKFFWENTILSDEGVYRVRVPSSFMDIYDGVRSTPVENRGLLETFRSRLPVDYKIVKAIIESPFRYTYLIERDDDRELIFTEWDLALAGATLYVNCEFFNAAVQGGPATISLLWASEGAPGIWKAAWTSDTYQFELYARRKLGSSGLLMSKSDVIDAADLLANAVRPAAATSGKPETDPCRQE